MADVKYEIVSGGLPTSGTGDFTITDFGTPKAAILFVTKATADDTITADAALTVGFTDGTRHVSVSMSSQDAVATTNVNRAVSDSHALYILDPSAAAGLDGSLTASFITDGVRLTVDNAPAAAYLCSVVLIGGSDVANAYVIEHDDFGTGTSAVTVSGVGGGAPFTPDHIFALCQALGNASPGQSGNTIFSFGTSDFTNHAGLLIGARDGQSATAADALISDTNILGRVFAGSNSWNVAASNPQSGSFDVTPTADAGTSVGYFLCLEYSNSPSISIHDTSIPTSGSVNEEDPAFEPAFMMQVNCQGPTAKNSLYSTSSGNGIAPSIILYDGTTTNVLTATIDDGAGSDPQKSTHQDSLKALDYDGSTTAYEGSIAFDSAGYNLTLTTNPAAAILGFGFAIDGPVADSTAPSLSIPTSTAVTQTTATVGCTTNEDNGTLYMVATSADSAPSAAQVKAGQNSGGTSAIVSANQAISTTGAKTFDIGSTLVPGTTYYLWYMHEDAATNQSTVLDGNSITMLSAFATTNTYTGGTIGSGSIGHYAAGTSDSGSATHMIDSGLVTTDDIFNGLTLHNDTDTASVVINDSIASTDRIEFTTGSVDFTSNDDYRITATVANGAKWYCEGTATVSGGSVDVDWYVEESGAYTPVYTQTINGLSEADGTYDTSLDANGALTLTLPVSSSDKVGTGMAFLDEDEPYKKPKSIDKQNVARNDGFDGYDYDPFTDFGIDG